VLISTYGFNTCCRTRQQCLRVGGYVSSKYTPSPALYLSRQTGTEILRCTNLFNGPTIRRSEPKSGLFHLRTAQSLSTLAMTTADNSNDVSNNSKNPFVKVWLWFRKLLARIWTLLKKPFQKSDSSDKAIDSTTEVSEPVQEGVVLTQMENLATVEDETKIEVKDLLDTAAAVTEKAEKLSKQVERAKITSAPATSTTSSVSRRATAGPTVDLSGNWTLIVDDAFKSQYDDYLRKLGSPCL